MSFSWPSPGRGRLGQALKFEINGVFHEMKGDATMKSDVRRRSVGVALALAAILALVIPVAAWAQEIPSGGPTSLPDYVGAPAKAHPTANSGVPQNPLLAPNGFNSCHLDPWMSDTADIAGPLGNSPAVLSSTFTEARPDPLPDPNEAPPWLFQCITFMFDSHGRLLALCFAPHEATAVLADPDTLEVLDHYDLGLPVGDTYAYTARQPFMRSLLSSYSYFDARDRLFVSSGGNQIVTLEVAGTDDEPVLEHRGTYDLTAFIPGEDNRLAGVMADWQGRIWMTTVGTPLGPAMVGVLNPAKCSYEDPVVNWYDEFPPTEVIRNTFAVTKAGGQTAAAYVATSAKLYRLDAGSDDIPRMVWSEPYDTVPYDTNSELYFNGVKHGQYELGTGTTPTVLGEGKYVAITDNAEQMKVVVFRTDDALDPGEERIVCAEPVFEEQIGQSSSNSLVGSRSSLIATNNFNYLWDWGSGELVLPSEPGAERIDIDPNGKGCTKVWTNDEIITTTSPRLSTRTGLIYAIAREADPETEGLYAYYWVALDFRTGQTVWKKLAGAGNRYDTFYPALAIGPNKALYTGVYGGILSMRDGR